MSEARGGREERPGGGADDTGADALPFVALERLAPGAPGADPGPQRSQDRRTSDPLIQIRLEPPEDLRSLRPAKGPAHNLPAPLNTFVGRRREMAEVVKLLDTSRLVTLTGPAGIGKTRLALQVALGLTNDHPDGVWLVDLTRLSDPALVPKEVAGALSLHDRPIDSLGKCLANYLRERQSLLVFDNCEHVIEAVAQLAETLLRSAPALQILATSREALGIAGETLWAVPPLSLPHPEEEVLPDQPMAASEAVRLFCERVAAPDFVLTPLAAPAVAEICRRLDGIPLAIELAAARVGVLSPVQIAARLDDRFSLLVSGSWTVLPRHRTLLAALEWSHDLLSSEEKVLLRRLSVFQGGFCLEAAEDVCAGDGQERGAILRSLTRLVNKSLAVSDATGSEARYRLLETIWKYASEKLADSGEEVAFRAAHARWCLHLAEQAEPELAGPDQASWCERLEAEYPNIRSALEWALKHEPQWALRIVPALTLFWPAYGHAAESQAWLERAWSASGHEAPPALVAKSRWGAGFMAIMLGDFDTARLAGREALETYRNIGSVQGCARALHVLGRAVAHFQDSASARPLLEESALLAREANDDWCLAGSLSALAVAELYESNLTAGRPLFEECVTVARRSGNPQRLAGGLLGLVFIALDEGRYEDAHASLEEAWPVARELATNHLTAVALTHLGALAHARGHLSRGRGLMVEAVELHHQAGLRPFLPYCLNVLGHALVSEGNFVEARPLFQESLSLSGAFGRTFNEALARLGLGMISVALHGAGAGRPILDEALAVARKSGNNLAIGACLHALGRLARSEGEFEDARSLHHEALGLQVDTGLRPGVIASLEALAGLAAAEQGRSPYAARLFGAAQAWRDAHGPLRTPGDQPRYDADIAIVKEALPSEELAAAWEAGAGLSLEDAVDYARRGRGPRRRPSTGRFSLTSAENGVAKLIAEGLTNAEIADRLFIAPRTVKAHVSNILAKLGFSSRRQIAREFLRRDV